MRAILKWTAIAALVLFVAAIGHSADMARAHREGHQCSPYFFC